MNSEEKNDQLVIEMTRGCICDSLTVNGKEEIDLTDEERHNILTRIANSKIFKNKILKFNLNDLLQFISYNMFDEVYADDEPCECCGDYVESYKVTL